MPESWSTRLIVSLAVFVVVVVGVSCSGASNGAVEEAGEVGVTHMTLHEDVAASNSVAKEASDVGVLGSGAYTEEEIGVEALVANYFVDRPSRALTRYRTYEEYDEASLSDDGLRSLSAEAKDRAWFEQSVRLLLLGAGEVMPLEVESASDELWHAYYASLDLCAERSEYPDMRLYVLEDGGYSGVSVNDEAQRLSITVDEFLDLHHECHKFAALYPVLDPEHRDELLKVRSGYYLEIVRLWMADNPELVVPLDYENSVNQPYQDYVREVCMEAEDPEGCAREEGVSFP